MSYRRRFISTFFVLLAFGLIAFYNISSKPRFETFHTTDVLTLIGAGMCFGVALVSLISFFRGPRSG
jgi:hypothetical protein